MNAMPSPETLQVIKLGGSLLSDRGLKDRLTAWLAAEPPARRVMIVGGGPFADAVREADRLHQLGEEASHWLAVKTMSLTARLVHALLRDSRLSSQWDDVAARRQLGSSQQCEAEASRDQRQRRFNLTILDPWDFLQAEETSKDLPSLPHCWDATSDSIAARLAVRLGAEELALLKSRLPTSNSTILQASKTGYVDRLFPREAKNLHVRCVNLRDDRFAEATLE